MQPFESFMQDPMAQFGLGILAANQPGASFGQAVGQGGLTAIQNMQRMGSLKEQSEYRKLQAEQLKAEMERAKAEVDRQAKMDAARAEWLRANPQYTDLASMGGFDPVADILKTQLMPVKPENDPEAYRSWKLAGSPGSYEDWYFRAKSAGGTNVTVAPVFNPLEKGVVSGMQSNVITADLAVDQASRTLDLVKNNRSVMGPLPRLTEKASALVSGAADFFGSETLGSLGQSLRPVGEGGASATDLTNALLATKTAAREIMAPDKGPLTQQEQADYKEGLGMLASSDAAVVMDGLEMLIDTMNRRTTRLKQFLRTSGSTVPGETAMPRVNSQSELQSLNLKDGDKFIAPDGSIRTYRKR